MISLFQFVGYMRQVDEYRGDREFLAYYGPDGPQFLTATGELTTVSHQLIVMSHDWTWLQGGYNNTESIRRT